jgi:hypothetical protein
MTTEIQSEYRNLSLASHTESALNPPRSFDEAALNELAESIKTQGVLAPLVVRPVASTSRSLPEQGAIGQHIWLDLKPRLSASSN